MVIGFVNDKNLNRILPLFPKNAIYYFAKPNNQRGLSVIELQKIAKKYELFGDVFTSVSEAFVKAKQQASSEDMIYVGGSTFVVSEIL